MIKFCLPFLLLLSACQNSGQKETPQQSRDLELPQLKRIDVSGADADSILATDLDVIVIEENYLVVRIPSSEVSALNMKWPVRDAEESDFCQRLIDITGWQKEDLTSFAEMGLDIWEVKGDTVKAQAFDKYIRQLESEGFSVNIIEKNALKVVQKK